MVRKAEIAFLMGLRQSAAAAAAAPVHFQPLEGLAAAGQEQQEVGRRAPAGPQVRAIQAAMEPRG